MFEIFLASLAAFLAGFVDAIAGGGGIISFPTLMYLNLPISMVVGTNKLVGTFGTGVAALTFFKMKKVNEELIKKAVLFTALGAVLGAALVVELSNEFLKPLIGTFLFLLALYFYLRPKLGSENSYSGPTLKIYLTVCLAALTIGFYDGFFGPGTGMFLMFIFVRFVKLDFVHAAANTKILNFTSNMVSLIYFIRVGHVDFTIGIPMALAGIVGGYAGAHSAVKVGPKFIRLIFLVMAILLAVRLIVTYK